MIRQLQERILNHLRDTGEDLNEIEITEQDYNDLKKELGLKYAPRIYPSDKSKNEFMGVKLKIKDE